MQKIVCRKSNRCQCDSISKHLEGFTAAERDIGYTPLTIACHIPLLRTFGEWLARQNIAVARIAKTHIEEFIRTRMNIGPSYRRDRSVLARFLEYLQKQNVINIPPQKESIRPSDRIIRQFTWHLEHERGFSKWTIVKYAYYVRKFLELRYKKEPIHLQSLQPCDLQAAVVDDLRRRGSSHAKALAIGLRCFIRWLKLCGTIHTDLAGCLPSVAKWKLQHIPTIINAQEVKLLLRSCDRQTLMGRRNYAIILLLARLGLRAGEIVTLQLEDIEWHNGMIYILGKGNIRRRLPMPPDVGAALASYLRYARPRCSDRHVFLCMNAPHRNLGHSSTVSSIVALALRRAAITPARRGAHLLRHSLASSLLNRRTPLMEIGQVLGHRSSQTTEIYAKVDIKNLRAVAQRWVGGDA
jgi:integrase/recombinase XerD